MSTPVLVIGAVVIWTPVLLAIRWIWRVERANRPDKPKCRACGGTGYIIGGGWNGPCPTCTGTGRSVTP